MVYETIHARPIWDSSGDWGPHNQLEQDDSLGIAVVQSSLDLSKHFLLIAQVMAKIKKSLAEACPQLAREWHPDRNGTWRPEDFSCHSKEKAWWLCPADPGHEWEQRIAQRVKTTCPFCRIIPLSLLTLFPNVARQLHPTKNADLNPALVSAHSKQRAWWQCEKNSDHAWEAEIGSRTGLRSGCPFCRGLKVDAANSLAYCYPEIANDWHPTKNAGLTPNDVVKSTHKKVWWMCQQKHEWQNTVNSRTNQQSGCPFCTGQYLTDENRLSVRFPEIAAEWHPTKNRKLRASTEGNWSPTKNFHLSPKDRSGRNRRLRPSDVSYGSGQRIWWQCKKSEEHVWQAPVSTRTQGFGCPFCRGLKVATDNCLSSRYPSIAKQWHPTRNLPLHPTEVTSGSGKTVWWRCAKSAKHVWQSPIWNIVQSWRDGHNGCPFCKGIRVNDESSLLAKFPEVAKNFHPTRNGDLTPTELSPGSNKVVWWKCPQSPDHVWKATVYDVIKASKCGRSGCHFCAGKKVSKELSLAGQYPEIARFWHPTLNMPVRPSHVLPHSNKSFWWRCPSSYEHVWERRVDMLLRTWKTGNCLCPYCSTNIQSKRIVNRAVRSRARE